MAHNLEKINFIQYNKIKNHDKLHHVVKITPHMKFWPFFKDADIDFAKVIIFKRYETKMA